MVNAGAQVARKAVFLDRDGVLVIPEFRHGRSYATRSLAGFKVYPEAASCLYRLRQAGFVLVVATNQPDVGAGLLSLRLLEEMHRFLQNAMPVDRIEVCTHTAADGCDCRKPKAGMLIRASKALCLDVASSFMVGDRASDMEAGQSVGCQTAFRDLGYSAEARPRNYSFSSDSLAAITDWIISTDKARTQDSCNAPV